MVMELAVSKERDMPSTAPMDVRASTTVVNGVTSPKLCVIRLAPTTRLVVIRAGTLGMDGVEKEDCTGMITSSRAWKQWYVTLRLLLWIVER